MGSTCQGFADFCLQGCFQQKLGVVDASHVTPRLLHLRERTHALAPVRTGGLRRLPGILRDEGLVCKNLSFGGNRCTAGMRAHGSHAVNSQRTVSFDTPQQPPQCPLFRQPPDPPLWPPDPAPSSSSSSSSRLGTTCRMMRAALGCLYAGRDLKSKAWILLWAENEKLLCSYGPACHRLAFRHSFRILPGFAVPIKMCSCSLGTLRKISRK